MGLTSIGDQKTPGRPVEISFDAETGLPSANQELCLIGHAATGTTAYAVVEISNVADEEAAQAEAEAAFGVGTELALMVLAAVKANAGGSTFPAIKCIPLAASDTGFGSSDEALTALKRIKAEYVVSPYTGSDATTRNKLKDAIEVMTGAQRVENNQFGSIGVVFNRSVTSAGSLAVPDTQYICPIWLRDTGTSGDAPDYSIGEMAAACAARMAANGSPFNPLDSVTIGGIDAPAKQSDWPTVGAGLESETALSKGWTPLFVKPNGEVAFVRTVTSRISADGSGSPVVGAYYDVQDFNVLYLWRKTVFTRFNQPDFKQRKASAETATEVLSEVLRLAQAFEDEGMFQSVKQLAKQFKVERSTSDRHRFDVLTPVNVVPGLHVIATNVRAGTQFDTLSI